MLESCFDSSLSILSTKMFTSISLLYISAMLTNFDIVIYNSWYNLKTCQ